MSFRGANRLILLLLNKAKLAVPFFSLYAKLSLMAAYYSFVFTIDMIVLSKYAYVAKLCLAVPVKGFFKLSV